MASVELCGLVGGGPRSPDDAARFERMLADLARTVGGTPVRAQLDWATLACVPDGDRAPTHSALVERADLIVGWAGDPPRDDPGHSDPRPDRRGSPAATLCSLRPSTRTCRIVGDRHGLVPLHVAAVRDGITFCTRLGPLLRSGLVDPQLDVQAVLELFTFEHVTGERSLARAVRLLGPGAVLNLVDGRLVEEHADDDAVGARDEPPTSSGDVAGRLAEALQAAVERAAGPSRRVSITLSGGLDSRALLGSALADGLRVSARTFGPDACRDVRCARELARRTHVPHTTTEIDGSFLPHWLEHAVETTGGMIAARHFHILCLADALAHDEAVVLDGLGGDALTGAHLPGSVLLARDSERVVDLVLRRRATVLRTPAERAALFEPDFLALAVDFDPRESVARHLRPTSEEAPWRGCHRFDLLERQRRFIQYGPHLLRRFVDVATPFYDHAVHDLLSGLPARQLVEQRTYLAMLRRRMPLLAAVRDANRGVPVAWPLALRFGKRVLDFGRRRLPRPVRTLVGSPDDSPTDYAAWFRGGLAAELRARLLDGGDVLEGIVARTTIERLLAEHVGGRADHAPVLGCLLSLATWLRSLR